MSILKEMTILDRLDRHSKIRKYERLLELWLNRDDTEKIVACLDLIGLYERPWEVEEEERDFRTAGQQLMEQYANQYPETLKDEEKE